MSFLTPRQPNEQRSFTLQHGLALLTLILGLVTILAWFYTPQPISLRQLARLIKTGEVESLVVRGDILMATQVGGIQVTAFASPIEALSRLGELTLTGTQIMLPLPLTGEPRWCSGLGEADSTCPTRLLAPRSASRSTAG